jgi:hypothetical protein
MRTTSFALTAVLVASLLAGFAAPAAAQGNGTDYTELPPSELDDLNNCPEPEPITPSLVLCDSELNDNGKAELTFRSDNLQRVLLTDAAAFHRGGRVPQRQVVLRGDEVNSITWDVTTHKGYAGVSVQAGDTLYAVPLEDQSTLVGPPWSATDVQLAAISAAAGVGVVSILVVIRAVLGRTHSPERVA